LTSPYCERAIEDALKYGNALLKFISRNNVGLTGSHECGFYLPKIVHGLFTPHPPEKGSNSKHDLKVTWQDGRVTESVVTWYGTGTRSEYRLTRFGKDFPFLNEGVVGDLLVLISTSPTEALAYVLDFDDDIEEIQITLGVDAFEQWGVFKDGAPQQEENEDACVERRIRLFAAELDKFPDNSVFSGATREILAECLKGFSKLSPDKALVKAYSLEYEIFQAVERQVCGNLISGRLFRNIDDFLKVASSIMNRRKSRAGRSLENHVESVLSAAGVPHQMRPNLGPDGTPDVIIPSVEAYFTNDYPVDRIFLVGLKTTCKDRWRQVTQEGPRVERKHLLTLQQGITQKQLAQMEAAKVTLIVPEPLHKYYPDDSPVQPLTVNAFVEAAKRATIA
jgi:EcoRII C terminal/Restriction endonuclease EcoRII, N-terminal